MEPEGETFGYVLEQLKKDPITLAAYRMGWNGKMIYIKLQVPDEHSKMTQPYLYIVTEDLDTQNPHAVKGKVPWLASQTDMLSEDWLVVVKM